MLILSMERSGMFESARGAYDRVVQARAAVRNQVREEFREAINARIDELAQWEIDDFLSELNALQDAGVSSPDIRFGVFGTNPTVASEWLRRAGIKGAKPGRPASENGPTHGKNSTYVRGCRCDECRAAANEYQREYYRRKKGSAKGED